MQITAAHRDSLIEFSGTALPHEVRGLLAGEGDRVFVVLPRTNVEQSSLSEQS